MQYNSNELIRDLGLSKSNTQLLGSRLKQWNLLDKDKWVPYFLNMQENLMSYLTKDDDMDVEILNDFYKNWVSLEYLAIATFYWFIQNYFKSSLLHNRVSTDGNFLLTIKL